MIDRDKLKITVIKTMYAGQVGVSKYRPFGEPKYSRDWLIEWALSQDKFHLLFDRWFENGRKRIDKPSVDRISNNDGYNKDNIQLMTVWQNMVKH